MSSDGDSPPVSETSGTAYVCPWCSTPLPGIDAPDCPACGAHLVEERDVEIPGLTAVSAELLVSAASPHRIRRTFGSLLVGSEDDDIPAPTEAEMPALAPPDAEVRREMLRLEVEARLTALQAEVNARRSDAGATPEPVPGPVPPDAAATAEPHLGEAAEPRPDGGPGASPER